MPLLGGSWAWRADPLYDCGAATPSQVDYDRSRLYRLDVGTQASMKIMVATYSQDLARKYADGCRTIMDSEWYRRLCPATRIKDGGNRQLATITTAGGSREAVSLRGSVTGHGADLIIVDDLMMADEAFSAAARENVRRWFDNTLVSRLNSKRVGGIVSIQQLLHEDDLPAYLIEKGYETLILPATAERDERILIGPNVFHHRRAGDLLNLGREDANDLARIRREMDPRAYASQYQQNPVVPEGNSVRIEWFGRVDVLPAREECQTVIQKLGHGFVGCSYQRLQRLSYHGLAPGSLAVARCLTGPACLS